MQALKISKGLSLPVDAVTQTIGILARKRAGKSFTARRLSEQLFKSSQQIVIADPKGDWWGIRASADGKSKGLPIIIFGGEHADVPLEPTVHSGELVAKLVVEERVSALLDMGQMRKGEMRTFMTAFSETLYRLKAQDRFRTPMMLLLDEADMFCPQKPVPDEARLLGAIDDIVRRGGQRGIGCTFISQRSAVVNKNILSQLQILVALRTIAPQDLKALDAWVENHGTPAERKILMDSLPSLPIGTAWVWSPGWPTEEGIFKRVEILPIETFDSGATPKAGEKQTTPRTMADIDLSAVRRQMADTLERAKAEDPKELRRQIAELRKAQTFVPPPLHITKEVKVEVPVISDKQVKALECAFEKISKEAERHGAAMSLLWGHFIEASAAVKDALVVIAADYKQKAAPPVNIKAEAAPPRPDAPQTPLAADNSPVTGSEQRILDSIAWFESIHMVPNAVAVGFLAKFSTGGHYTNLKGALRTKGLITYPSPGLISLTDAGRLVARRSDFPLTQAELHDKVREVLGGSLWRILKVLIDAHPRDLSTEEVRAAADFKEGGHFTNLKGRLHTLTLISYPAPGRMQATDFLFIQ